MKLFIVIFLLILYYILNSYYFKNKNINDSRIYGINRKKQIDIHNTNNLPKNNTNNLPKNNISSNVESLNNLNNTNIYRLAPFDATSLNFNDFNKLDSLNKMQEYPNNMQQKLWCENWTNKNNNFYCFIDKHLNRKCLWSCK